MAHEARIAPADQRYADETQRRIGEIRGIFAIRRCGESDIDGVMGRLREQAQASRLAGFPGIAGLCGTMENCLAVVHRGERRQPAGVAATLLDACETIRLHARGVGKGVIHAHGGRRQMKPDGLCDVRYYLPRSGVMAAS